MAQSTGPILACGALTLANQSIFHGQPVDWRVPVATGLAAMGFAFAEQAWPQGARMLAWTALLAVVFTRTNADVPSPVESAITWWNSGGGTPQKGSSSA
jgi:hypothetical protein